MTLCQAYNTIQSKGMTPWMAYAILKWNDEFCIFSTQQIKKFPKLCYLYIRKGERFPGNPILDFPDKLIIK